MSRLDDLRRDLLKMTPEEKLAKLREVRADRRVSKHAVTVRKKQEKDRTTKLAGKFAELSPEDQAMLLEALKDG